MWVNFSAVGRLTRDASEGLKYVKIGGEDVAVCSFTIACDGPTKDSETDFYDCVVWRKTAENLAKYQTKGKLLLVSGRPRTRSYEKDGIKHYRTEFNIDTVKFLSPNESGQKATTTVKKEVYEPVPF